MPVPQKKTAVPVRRRRKEARPQELAAAALAVFVEKGFAATRLEDIAARAGVSKGTLYLYFDSKEALFKSVICEGVIPAIEAGETLLQTFDGDPVALLRCLLYGWWEHIGSGDLGGVVKLMMSEARNFPEVAAYFNENVVVRGHGLIRVAIERGVAAGLFRPVDQTFIGNVLMAPLLHLALWRHSFAPCCPVDMDVGQYLDTYFDLVMHGLSADGGNTGVSA